MFTDFTNEAIARLQVAGWKAAERFEDEDGQGAVEYAGVAVLVLLVITAIIRFAPEIGTAIEGTFKNIFEQLQKK